MIPGTRVSFFWDDNAPDGHVYPRTGLGSIVLVDHEAGNALVACDPDVPARDPRHNVIQCALTWLTEVIPNP